MDTPRSVHFFKSKSYVVLTNMEFEIQVPSTSSRLQLQSSNRPKMASSFDGAQSNVKFGESSETVLVDPCRSGCGCWRPLRVWTVDPTAPPSGPEFGRFWPSRKFLRWLRTFHQKRIPVNMPEQTVDMPVSQVEVAVSSGEVGSSRPGSDDATSAASAASTVVAKSVGEARPLGIAEHRALTESELVKLSDYAGSSWSRAHGTTSAAAAAVEKPVGGGWLLGFAEHSATTGSEFAEYSVEAEAVSSWCREKFTTGAAGTAVAKSAGGGRLLGIAQYKVTSESELAKSFDYAGSSRTRASGTAIADVTAVEKSVGEVQPVAKSADEAQPPGFAKHGATLCLLM